MVDIQVGARSFPSVSAPRNRLLSVIFIALWFVATQHCALEAAELFVEHAAEQENAGCCGANGNGCETDGCKAVEDAQYRSDVQSVKAAAPDLMTCVCLLRSSLLRTRNDDTLLAAKETWDEAPDWVSSWRFERRAAAPAHAPDSLIA